MSSIHSPLPGLVADRLGGLRVAFLGKSFARRGEEPTAALERTLEREHCAEGTSLPQVAWNRQVHSNSVELAMPGRVAEADALWTEESGVALAVLIADCVPILLGGRRCLAAVHAGWRGLGSRILAETLSVISETPSDLVAWIGPSIGPCCYEVGSDVAHQVAAVSGPDVVRRGNQPRPHLDLAGAAQEQLSQLGVRDVRLFARCTGCNSSDWWSHRKGAGPRGRNLAFIWRAAAR